MSIPFIDLKSQQARIRQELDAAIARVLEHGQYILGPEVTAFEQALCNFENAAAVVACANGTDALVLSIRALGVGVGDAVFCPSYTYTATAEAIILAGATPVFVDIEPVTYNMSADSLKTAIQDILDTGSLSPKAVIAVDLFGHPANYPDLSDVARRFELPLISDNAQSLGSRMNGKSTVEYADIATTSFFPAKPLGCYGDGGAVLLKDPSLEPVLRSLAFHGRGSDPYDHDRIGYNSRLDSLQAAILLEKLKIFPKEIEVRNQVADRYRQKLQGVVKNVPYVAQGCVSTWAQYAIEVENRDSFLSEIRSQGLPVAAYYPRPVHEQTAYKQYPVVSSGLPETNRAKQVAAALPMHAYLTQEDQDKMIEAIKSVV